MYDLQSYPRPAAGSRFLISCFSHGLARSLPRSGQESILLSFELWRCDQAHRPHAFFRKRRCKRIIRVDPGKSVAKAFQLNIALNLRKPARAATYLLSIE